MPETNLFSNLGKKHVLWALLLLIPALYINLDMLPLIGDEAIRAVVTLEMMFSGDYITPTLNGELYFNKPPLFNWILAGFFSVTGRDDEFMVRLPTTLFLLVYALTIFLWIKKYVGRDAGILAALFFVTCSRVLFWDSFLGLIDITYSWLLFLNFMLIWHYYSRKSFAALFLVSYIICAITFLLKGVPSLAFQALTLLTLFVQQKNYRILFNRHHFAGIFIFLVITGSYYVLYHFQNPGHLSQALERLITESTQKSAIGSTLENTVAHFFKFPFEVLYHFFPWTILVVFLFNRTIMKKAFASEFILYCALVFIVNIMVYWFSPITYPRYLLMLMPLFYVVLVYAGHLHQSSKTLNYRIVHHLVIFTIAGLSLCSLILPLVFHESLPVKNLLVKVLVLAAILALMGYTYFSNQKKGSLLYYLVLVVLISRLSFDLFLVPYRQSDSWMHKCKQDAKILAQGTKGQDLFVIADTLNIPNVYYIMKERREILKFKSSPDTSAFYLIEKAEFPGYSFNPQFAMRIPYYRKTYYAGKFYTP